MQSSKTDGRWSSENMLAPDIYNEMIGLQSKHGKSVWLKPMCVYVVHLNW